MHKKAVIAAVVVVALIIVIAAVTRKKPASASAYIAGPQAAGTDSLQFFAAGMGKLCYLTPNRSGDVEITFSGTAAGTTGTLEIIAACDTSLYGNDQGTPLQNPPIPLIKFAGPAIIQVQTGSNTPFTYTAVIRGLTIGLQYRFDLGLKARPGPAAVLGVTFKATEK